MLGDGLDAASAAFRVGYHNTAHFNREYKNLFGLPPMRDIERLRSTTRENASLAADKKMKQLNQKRQESIFAAF